MNQRVVNFIEDNGEAFKKLSEIVRDAKKDIGGPYVEYSTKERKMAIKIVERWIRECYGEAYSHKLLPEPEEEQLYFRILEDEMRGNGVKVD